MAANAARSAMHAARLSWLVAANGARKSQAIQCATKAVHTALRLTLLDLPALADQVDAAPNAGACLMPCPADDTRLFRSESYTAGHSPT